MAGGNANTTLSYPWKPNWHMMWDNGGLDNFQLDIVGFLAVLGEGSVTANYQVSALSRLFYLPRLIPAPQALLPARRPTELPSKTAWVTGVYSGNVKEHIHHVAGILLENSMPPFAVRCVEVTKETSLQRATRLDTMLRGVPQSSFKRSKKQTPLMGDKIKTQSPTIEPPPVKATATGPLAIVTIIGFIFSLVLFVVSIMFGDSWSLWATLLLSFLSTLIGAANKWTLKLPRRTGQAPTPGDTVIRYPNGSFLVVKCEEDVARELYFAPEEIEYNIQNPTIYRMLSLVGTVMLMLGVVALANAKLQLQFAWGGAYILINIAHWIAAAVPPKLHWDLNCYDVKEQSIAGGWKNPTFTDALWKAILVTKSTQWTRNGKAAPKTETWDQWLFEAETMANLAKNHHGPLIDPMWPGQTGDEKEDHDSTPWGTIWDAPKDPQAPADRPRDWNAKAAWDEIHMREKDNMPQMPAPSAPATAHMGGA